LREATFCCAKQPTLTALSPRVKIPALFIAGEVLFKNACHIFFPVVCHKERKKLHAPYPAAKHRPVAE
jgi:hypothetical protein